MISDFISGGKMTGIGWMSGTAGAAGTAAMTKSLQRIRFRHCRLTFGGRLMVSPAFCPSGPSRLNNQWLLGPTIRCVNEKR